MLLLLISFGIAVCAWQAVRSPRLLYSSLWLAGTSALTALLIYLLGAPEIAVIELSVGAGLVTVLFVFAINIAGEEIPASGTVVPRLLSIASILLLAGFLAWFLSPLLEVNLPLLPDNQFSKVVWQNRSLDAFLQSFLIFVGVLSVLGLLAESTSHQGEENQS